MGRYNCSVSLPILSLKFPWAMQRLAGRGLPLKSLASSSEAADEMRKRPNVLLLATLAWSADFLTASVFVSYT